MAAALAEARRDELRRGVSLVGPHRDDVELAIGGLPARTHASQGEQRSLALALRLAAHRVVTAAAGSPPVLLLDDVFSELDPGRSDALLASLPAGQTLLTTAERPAPGGGARSACCVVEGGTVRSSIARRRRCHNRAHAVAAAPVVVGRASRSRWARASTGWCAAWGAPSAQLTQSVFADWDDIVGPTDRPPRPAPRAAGADPRGGGGRPGLGHPAAVPRARAARPDRGGHRVRRGHAPSRSGCAARRRTAAPVVLSEPCGAGRGRRAAGTRPVRDLVPTKASRRPRNPSGMVWGVSPLW